MCTGPISISHLILYACMCTWLELLGDPKVCQSYEAIQVDQHVFGLDVTMKDTVLVQLVCNAGGQRFVVCAGEYKNVRACAGD